MQRLLLFDFDGTLYRGDDPFRYYAKTIAKHMAPEDRARYEKLVTAHLQGHAGVVAGDNWEAVVKLAEPYVPDHEVWQQSFLETREYMMSPDCRLEVPAALIDFLPQVRAKVHVVVASNSPENAARPLMEKLGLITYFDRIYSQANKPEGLIALVEEIMGTRDFDPLLVYSVGDNYLNDIAPAVQRGWLTAHISPHEYFPGPSTIHARNLEDVLPHVTKWALG